MSTTSGALGFVQGLQGGMEHADGRRRNKAIDNLLDRDKYEFDMKTAANKLDFENQGGDLADFPEFSNPAEGAPPLVRGFNWLKDKFGFGSKPSDEEATAGLTEGVKKTQDEGAIPFQTGMGMADGGSVEEERKQRSYGDYYVSEDEAAENRADRSRGEHRNRNPYHQRYAAGVDRQGMYNDNTGGGIREAANDVKRAAIPVFDDTRRMAIEGQADVDEAHQGFSDAKGARETGAAIRDVAGAHIRHKGATALGVAKDIFADNPLTQGLLGFVGFEGTRDNRQAEPGQAPKSMGPKGESPKAKAIEAAVGNEETDKGVAGKAVEAAIEMTPGHPDNPEQAFDWSEVAASGVTPEDLPDTQVKDWAQYRQRAGQAAALRGESVEEKQMEITKMQMEGFSANSQQAAFLLRQGDPRGAALAMRMAYQYFPNGSDVRFGIAEGTQGPVLVGMGYDEQTGEAVGESEEPMLLTPDVINAFVNQVSDPSAWNTWTKDWHEAAQEDREYNEITKPQAQADLDLTGAKTDYYQAGADAERADAAGGGKDPLRQSDYDRAYAFFSESQELLGLEDEATADYLADIMSRIYQRNPGTPMTSVKNFVMTEHREGTLEEGLAEIGLR